MLAKSPIAGRVKTRLCPPLDHVQAADLAAVALHETLTAVAATGATDRVLVLDGPAGPWLPVGFQVITQRGTTLTERLAAAWADGGGPAVQIGMDTPQADAGLLDDAMATLERSPFGSVLGLADDGGWWALGLRVAEPRVFGGVPMSSPDTGAAQRAALTALGLDPVLLPTLRDVDTWCDALHVADQFPHLRFAARVGALASQLRPPAGAGVPG